MKAYWTQEKERFTFTIRGDGFLYRMVRNIVGCLVKVGTGEWTVADFAAVMAARTGKKPAWRRLPCGLSLVHVSYPEETAEIELSFAVFFAIS